LPKGTSAQNGLFSTTIIYL